jgi:hypothetical protein
VRKLDERKIKYAAPPRFIYYHLPFLARRSVNLELPIQSFRCLLVIPHHFIPFDTQFFPSMNPFSLMYTEAVLTPDGYLSCRHLLTPVPANRAHAPFRSNAHLYDESTITSEKVGKMMHRVLSPLRCFVQEGKTMSPEMRRRRGIRLAYQRNCASEGVKIWIDKAHARG